MTTRIADGIGYLRSAGDDDPLLFHGLIPYGQPTQGRVPEYGKPEAFGPGTFAADATRWMNRDDKAKVPFRPEHKARPVGALEDLRDTPAGLAYTLRLRDTPAGREYADDVRAGLNGVSPEFAPNEERSSMRGKVVVHHEARLLALAGAVNPAYDGARLSLRDMEDNVPDNDQDIDTTPPVRTAEERRAERDSVADVAPRGSTISITRQELPYSRDETWSGTDERGRRYSLLSDGYHAKFSHDSNAQERLWKWEQARDEYEQTAERAGQRFMERAGDVISTEIPGAYPNIYLPGLLTPRILKGRPMGGFFDRFPISDALPKIFPKVTTSTTVAVQSAENANPAASDFATTAVTTTPLLYGAETVVSRQVIDGSNPAAEAMIQSDMLEAYAQASETVIKTAVEAGASASGTAITAATPYVGATGNVLKYYTTRFKAAQAQFVPAALYGVLALQPDTSSLRPLLAFINPQNSDGTISEGGINANILGALVLMSYASTVNVVVTARQNDYVIFESPIARFTYDAVTGPSAVRMGLWAYLAVGTRLGGLSVTAA